MAPEDVTLAEALQMAGYTTAHIGKCHLQTHHEKGRTLFSEANGFDINLAGGKNGQPASYYFPYTHYHHINTMGPAGTVRMGDYKLVEVFETGKVELYNLSDDLGETNDLAASMPELTAKLTKMLHDWRNHSGAVMTTENPNYKAEDDWHKPAQVK